MIEFRVVYFLLFFIIYLVFFDNKTLNKGPCVDIPCVPFVHLKRSCRQFSLVDEPLFNLGLRYMTVVVNTVLTNWYVTIFFGISVRAFLFRRLKMLDSSTHKSYLLSVCRIGLQ